MSRRARTPSFRSLLQSFASSSSSLDRPSTPPPVYTIEEHSPPEFDTQSHRIYSRSARAGSEEWQSTLGSSTIDEHEEDIDAVTRPVFYRVYSPESALLVRIPCTDLDPALGSTYAHYVSPPHTTTSLRRHIAMKEGLTGYDAELYVDITSETPLPEGAAVAIAADNGIGHTSFQPIALVIKEPPMSPSRRQSVSPTLPLINASRLADVQLDWSAPRSVFYRLYTPDGVINTHVPAPNFRDPTLGRTWAHVIPPSHSPATIIRHIRMLEDIPSTTPVQLFSGIQSTAPLDSDNHLSLTDPNGPGFSAQQPLVLVLFDALEEQEAHLPPNEDDQPLTPDSLPIPLPSPSSPNPRRETMLSDAPSTLSTAESTTFVDGKPRGWLVVQMTESQTSNGNDGCHTVKKGDVLYMHPKKQSEDSSPMWHRHKAVFPGEREIKYILRPGPTKLYMGGKETIKVLEDQRPVAPRQGSSGQGIRREPSFLSLTRSRSSTWRT